MLTILHMRFLLLMAFYIPLVCIAQTDEYIPTKTKYLELVEITDKLFAITSPIDSIGRYRRVDSICYVFKLTPYPDQQKKYNLQKSLKVILCSKTDTFINKQYKVSLDSSSLSFYVPTQYKNFNLEIFILTEYKRRWRKAYRKLSEKVISIDMYCMVDSKILLLKPRGIICYGQVIEIWQLNYQRQINEVRKKYNYSVDELIIRTVPGVN